MKRIGIFLLFGLIILSACKKNNTPSPGPYADTRLVIGYALDFPPFTSHMYLITSNGLYEDTNAASVTSFNFTAPALDSAKYQLAYPLLSNFPTYLDNGTGGNISDDGLVGTGALHLEYTKNGHTVKWNMPPTISMLPTQIQAYVTQVNTIFVRL